MKGEEKKKRKLIEIILGPHNFQYENRHTVWNTTFPSGNST